jgi:AraC-like DNA-binding protein
MELCSAPLDVTVLSVALGTHGADVFAAQRLRGSLKFRHGDLQLMQRGVSPRAAMGEGWRMLHSYLPQSLLMPISAIAAQVSSGDPSHFARPFRREVGTRPAPYRRERWS